MEQAYELTHRPGAELMRSRYCVRHQLGLCPKQKPGTAPEPLFLTNNGKRLRLRFHCPTCEMTVEEA
jgi:putative protease